MLGKGSSFGTTELRPDGGYTALIFPRLIATDIASFKVCSGFVFARDTDGSIWCWGNNQAVRNPSTREKNIEANRKAVDCSFLDIAQLGYPSDEVYSFFVVKEDASLWTARVTNRDDEIGFEFIYRMLDSVESVCADGGRVIALDHAQQVWQWDYIFEEKENYTPDAEKIGTPRRVLENTVEIAAGTDCFFATKSDGTLFAWGSTADGQIGDHAAIDYASNPLPVLAHARLTAPAPPSPQANGDAGVTLEQSNFETSWLFILAAAGILMLGMIGLILHRRSKMSRG